MKKRLFIIAILVSLIFIILQTTANAVVDRTPTFPGDYKFSRGVGNTCYYIGNTASRYANGLNNAANRWVYTGVGGNPIHMTLVSSNKGTHIDIYSSNPDSDTYLDSTMLAYTSFYKSNGQFACLGPGIGPWEDYFYTTIIINNSVTVSTGTFVHEMGHAFGLSHYNSNPQSIMCQLSCGRKVNTVQECDNESINYLYN